MYQTKTGTKRFSAKTGERHMAANAKILTNIKCFAKLEQHFITNIQSCYLNI